MVKLKGKSFNGKHNVIQMVIFTHSISLMNLISDEMKLILTLHLLYHGLINRFV